MRVPCSCGRQAWVDVSTMPATARCRECGSSWPMTEPVLLVDTVVAKRYRTDSTGYCAELNSFIGRSPSGDRFTIPVDT